MKSLLISLSIFLLSFTYDDYTYAQELISGEFQLIDHRGNLVSKANYNGKLRLVFFGFTECVAICPTTMAQVARVMKLLDDQSYHVQPIFITIDPQNDNILRLSGYVTAFHPAIVGLTGNAQQIDLAAKGFNATYGRHKAESNADSFYHSAFLYLMDREGEFLHLFGYGTSAKTIVEKVRHYL